MILRANKTQPKQFFLRSFSAFAVLPANAKKRRRKSSCQKAKAKTNNESNSNAIICASNLLQHSICAPLRFASNFRVSLNFTWVLLFACKSILANLISILLKFGAIWIRVWLSLSRLWLAKVASIITFIIPQSARRRKNQKTLFCASNERQKSRFVCCSLFVCEREKRKLIWKLNYLRKAAKL